MALDINQIVNRIEASDADDLGIEDIEDFSTADIDDDQIECSRGGFFTMKRDIDDYSAYDFADR